MSGIGDRIKGPTFGLKKQHLKKSNHGENSYSYEEELLLKPFVTPDDIMRLPRITQSKTSFDYIFTLNHLLQSICMFIKDYMCEPDANVYSIEFTRFKIRDYDTGNVLFEISKPTVGEFDSADDLEASKKNRFVRYQFSAQFLKLKTVGAT